MQNIKEFYSKHRKLAIVSISVEVTLALLLILMANSLPFTLMVIAFLSVAFVSIAFISSFNMGYGGSQIDDLNRALEETKSTLDEVVVFTRQRVTDEEWNQFIKAHNDHIQAEQESQIKEQMTKEQKAEEALKKAAEQVAQAKKEKKLLKKLQKKRL